MLIIQEQLTCATGYSRRADIEKWLISNNVPFLYGKHDTLITTVTAVDKALLSKTQDDIDFE